MYKLYVNLAGFIEERLGAFLVQAIVDEFIKNIAMFRGLDQNAILANVQAEFLRRDLAGKIC